MPYLRTNYRLTGCIVDMRTATDLTDLGAMGVIPSGYLAYSASHLLIFMGDGFIAIEEDDSTGA